MFVQTLRSVLAVYKRDTFLSGQSTLPPRVASVSGLLLTPSPNPSIEFRVISLIIRLHLNLLGLLRLSVLNLCKVSTYLSLRAKARHDFLHITPLKKEEGSVDLELAEAVGYTLFQHYDNYVIAHIQLPSTLVLLSF